MIVNDCNWQTQLIFISILQYVVLGPDEKDVNEYFLSEANFKRSATAVPNSIARP